MESMEWRVEADGFHGMADGFHGISRWIPYCFHSGVHMESMESIWTIVVTPSFSFPNVVKSCYLVLFPLRKMQKNKKKCGAFENLLPHISTTEAL